MTTAVDTAAAVESLGPAMELAVRRDGGLDFVVNGWVIGDGKQETSSGRIIQVVIYASVSGKIITEVRRSFGPGTDVQYSAAVFDAAYPSWALDWLKADNDGSLGRASKDAWIEACNNWPPLVDYSVERVD